MIGRILRKLTDERSTPMAHSTETHPEWIDPPKTTQEFTERLRLVGYADHVAAFTALVRPGLRLIVNRGTVDAESASLRLGGRPRLPQETAWPRRKNGSPLSLVAQLDLAQLSVAGLEMVVPAEGSLAFFYDAIEQSAWGFNPSDRDAWAVLHCPNNTGDLRDYPDDLDEEGRYPPTALVSNLEPTFPPAVSFDVEMITGECWPPTYGLVLGASDGADDQDARDNTDHSDDKNEPVHRWLGHPDPVQGDMQVECQLASNGVYVGNDTGYASDEGQRLRPGAQRWRLLLQVDSDDDADMMWGDEGRLYWWISETDLTDGRWEGAWLILQCS